VAEPDGPFEANKVIREALAGYKKLRAPAT
jgi:hypothetical protein